MTLAAVQAAAFPQAVQAASAPKASVKPSAKDATGEMTAGIARGDAAAFDVFYDAWFDRALTIAQRVSQRDEQTCLDLVQTVMLKAARSMPVMHTEDDVARWMSRVIHTAAIDLFRVESRRRRREALGGGESGRALHGRIDESIEERIEWLRVELEKLGPEDRSLIRLRFFAGASLDQVGAALGITGDAAHGRIRRLIRRLRSSGRSP